MALMEGFYKFGYYGEDGSVDDSGLILVDGGKLTILEDPKGELKHLLKRGNISLDLAEHIMKGVNRNHYAKFSYSDDQELYEKYNDALAQEHEFFKSDVPAAGPNMDARGIAESYMRSRGQSLEHPPKVKVNEPRAQKIAQAYHEMKHDPGHPQVKRAYDALKQETLAQFKHLQQHGLQISRIKPGQENPYKTSKDLMHDIRQNNHMWYFPTEQGFGSAAGPNDHPMLEHTGIEHEGKPLLANDVFRIVHDYFGHVKEGHGFGPHGEENAWHNHMKMYSPEAQKALTTETRGQNSWVNFGPHGEHNRKNPSQTIYADQKAGLMPDWTMQHSADDVAKAEIYEIWDLEYPIDADLVKSSWDEPDLSEHHGKDVFVYYNLHKKVWSIKDRKSGLVIAHSKRVAVDNPQFKVSEAGRQRVLRDKAKNVHAGVVGKLNAHHEDFSGEGRKRVSYNPYKHAHFYESDTQAAVHSAESATLHVQDKTGSGGKAVRIPHVYAKNPTSNSPAVTAEVEKAESLEKALSADELKSQGYKFNILKPTANREAYAVTVHHKGKRVGHVLYSTSPRLGSRKENEHQKGFHEVYRAEVDEGHRGKGIYQHMLSIGAEHVKSMGGKGLMSQGFQRSPDATHAWDKAGTFAVSPADSTSIKPLPYSADYFIEKSEEKIPGGLSSGKNPQDFDQEQLADGIKVEMEHTSDKAIAQEIAMDHLTEDADYYKKLKTIEAKKAEPLSKPYASEAQRRWAHTPAGKEALGGEEAVRHWDKESKGKKLPEKVEKAAEDLDKGWKDLAVGAAMVGALAGGSKISPTQDRPGQVHQAAPHVDLHEDLEHISMIESSGGKNKKHALTTVGLNAGHRAGGATGLMPITVKEAVNKNPKLNEKYGHLIGMGHHEITAQINANPNMEKEIANSHWDRLNRTFKGDKSRMAYAWRNGITASKNASDAEINSHPYVQKFNELKERNLAVLKSNGAGDPYVHMGHQFHEVPESQHPVKAGTLPPGHKLYQVKGPHINDHVIARSPAEVGNLIARHAEEAKRRIAKAKKIAEIARDMILEKIGQVTHNTQPQSVGHDVFQKELESVMGAFSVDNAGIRSMNDRKKEDDRKNSLDQVPNKHKKKFEQAMNESDPSSQVLSKLTSLKGKIKR